MRAKIAINLKVLIIQLIIFKQYKKRCVKNGFATVSLNNLYFKAKQPQNALRSVLRGHASACVLACEPACALALLHM